MLYLLSMSLFSVSVFPMHTQTYKLNIKFAKGTHNTAFMQQDKMNLGHCEWFTAIQCKWPDMKVVSAEF